MNRTFYISSCCCSASIINNITEIFILTRYLARNVKGNKSFYTYTDDKRKTKENMGLLLNGAQEVEKAEILNILFDSDFFETIKFRIVIFYLQ